MQGFVVDAALVRPLPYVVSVDGAGQRVPVGAAEFFALAKNAKTVEAIGTFYPHAGTFASATGPTQLRIANLSASMFTTLGISPARGRAFEAAEDLAGGEPVVIVSDAFWRRELGADPAALGRTLQVDHKPVVVVGVLPADAAFPRLDKYELFFPLAITPEQAAMSSARSGLYGVARLRPGITAAAAKAEMQSIVHATSGYGVTIEPLLRFVIGEAAPALQAAFAAVLLLLAIACANVALLLLVRGAARAQATLRSGLRWAAVTAAWHCSRWPKECCSRSPAARSACFSPCGPSTD